MSTTTATTVFDSIFPFLILNLYWLAMAAILNGYLRLTSRMRSKKERPAVHKPA